MSGILGEKDICKKCGKCCRLVSSLKSYEELCKDAQNGDIVAVNFLKLFLPYDSLDEVLKIDADMVRRTCEFNKRTYGTDTVTYFYYCRYIGADSRCTVYAVRPKVCRRYPLNEFVILPQDCAYEGYSFIQLEKVKAKVRKAKEQLLDIKVLRTTETDKSALERLNKVEKKCIQFIEQYKLYGSADW